MQYHAMTRNSIYRIDVDAVITIDDSGSVRTTPTITLARTAGEPPPFGKDVLADGVAVTVDGLAGLTTGECLSVVFPDGSHLTTTPITGIVWQDAA